MSAPERIQTPALTAEDELDRSLRPRSLGEFVGQPALREQLALSVEAAVARGEALEHLLLAGPPGLGKTSLAQIVALELEAPFVATAGPALERKGDVAAFLTALEPGSVFFVDEIHRLPRALEEAFYPAMEDRRLPITVGQGAGARVVTLDQPPVTQLGAPTRAGLITPCSTASSPTPPGTSPRSCAARRASWAWRSTPRGPWPSPRAAAARPAWPTACCAARATSPRCARAA